MPNNNLGTVQCRGSVRKCEGLEMAAKRKAMTTLSSVIKEKLIFNLSFPLAWANIKGGVGGGGGDGSTSEDITAWVTPQLCPAPQGKTKL